MTEKPIDPGYPRLVALVIIMVVIAVGVSYQRYVSTRQTATVPTKPVVAAPAQAEIRAAPKPKTLFDARRAAVKVWRDDHRPIPSQYATEFLRELIMFETTPEDMDLTATETHMLLNAKKRLMDHDGGFSRH